MRVLGVQGSTDFIFLAAAESGAVLDVEPTRIEVPNDLKLPANLTTLKGEIGMALGEIKPDKIVVLIAGAPESSHQRATARVGAETVLRMVALERNIPTAFVTRQSCKSELGLVAGDLGAAIDKGLTRVDPYWAKRKFAIAAALAAIA